MDDGSEAYERSRCNYSGISIWRDLRIGSRIFSSLFKNTAIHRNTWRNVLSRGLTALISSDMISIENPTFLSLANYRIYFGFITYYNNRGVAMHPYIYLSVVIALWL